MSAFCWSLFSFICVYHTINRSYYFTIAIINPSFKEQTFMSYRTALDLASALSDTDKLKLAHHLLGQLMLSPKSSSAPTPKLPPSADYDYCLERVLKSRPNRLPALQTFLEAIFSFRGGQDANIDDIIKRLELNKIIKKEGDNVVYLVD
jgi:hypothetical protein